MAGAGPGDCTQFAGATGENPAVALRPTDFSLRGLVLGLNGLIVCSTSIHAQGKTMFKGLTRSLAIIMSMIVAVPYLIIAAVE